MNSFVSQLFDQLLTLPKNVWAAIRPAPADVDQKRLRRSFIYHVHPLRCTLRACQPITTLGLGIASITLFAILCLTGAALMIYYIPTTQSAYDSMLDIEHAVTFGSFVRSLHRWSAHAMVISVVLHLLRIIAQRAYRYRERNWLLGLILLLFTLGLAFTGYLLPWDQRSYWAVVVSANLFDHVPYLGPAAKQLFLGGQQIGQSTLLRFYMLHVALLPTALLLTLAWHLWRIRKDGGLAVEPNQRHALVTLPTWPHLIVRELIVVVWVIALMVLLSMIFEAPLGFAPDFHHPSNPEKAPWYFLWLQEAVSYSSVMGGIIFPAILAAFLFVLPHLDHSDDKIGIWFPAGPQRIASVVSIGLACLCFGVFQWIYAQFNLANGTMPDLLNPATGMLLLSCAAFFVIGWSTRSLQVACQAVTWILLLTVVGFILIGLCRGPNWEVYPPWEVWPRAN